MEEIFGFSVSSCAQREPAQKRQDRNEKIRPKPKKDRVDLKRRKKKPFTSGMAKASLTGSECMKKPCKDAHSSRPQGNRQMILNTWALDEIRYPESTFKAAFVLIFRRFAEAGRANLFPGKVRRYRAQKANPRLLKFLIRLRSHFYSGPSQKSRPYSLPPDLICQ